MSSGLPIDAALPALADALRSNGSAVLQAPPGAGKSTVVPLELLRQPWSDRKKILMLEPRRVAARAVAQRMAMTLGERVGRTVGYRTRLDTRVSEQTRIEVVTEGVLTRMLQTDPELTDVAIVVFDEFHERSLQADLGLALVLDVTEHLVPALKVLVMSATLDGEAVAGLLRDAPVITAPGRQFQVETRFVGRSAPVLPSPSTIQEYERSVTQAILRALHEESGDILVFLPGAREIRRVGSLLESHALPADVRALPLYGDLSADEQDEALNPVGGVGRKIILATNIAETSLTIEGVRVVVDSGLVRRSAFDPQTGMNRLETRRISRAAAEQRQGRAGRLGPGVCYRLWSEAAHRGLAPFTPAEILEADLTPLALDLANWGTPDPSQLKWLDQPPSPLLSSSRDLLLRLGAIDAQARITEHGRRISRLSAHPRLAHMLLRSVEIDRLGLAADLAALLSDRDLLRSRESVNDSDLRTRLELLRETTSARGVERSRVQRLRLAARALEEQVRTKGTGTARRVRAAHDVNQSEREVARAADDATGILLAFAYPDRIGRRRPGSEARYTLANGRGATFSAVQSLGQQELIVAVDLDDRERDARILLAAPLSRAVLEEHFAERLERQEVVEWNAREQAVAARSLVRLDAIVLEEKPLIATDPERLRRAMLAGIEEMGLEVLPWTADARNLQARMRFVRGLEMGGESCAQAWPDVSNPALASSLDKWLSPWLAGITRREHLTRLSLSEILSAMLGWDQRRRLDELAPSHLDVPTGSRIRIDYIGENAPSVAVRLQELFGLEATPRIGGGRVPITFELLSPAQRPVQVTRDLAGFWRGSYAEVRKELRGRYPKHYWPDNPLEAEPTRGPRRRR